jgi:hypothetical protein
MSSLNGRAVGELSRPFPPFRAKIAKLLSKASKRLKSCISGARIARIFLIFV